MKLVLALILMPNIIYFECSCTGLGAKSRCVGVSRVGSSDQIIACNSLDLIHEWNLGSPLHSMVIVGTVHPLEEKLLTIACNAKRSTV